MPDNKRKNNERDWLGDAVFFLALGYFLDRQEKKRVEKYQKQNEPAINESSENLWPVEQRYGKEYRTAWLQANKGNIILFAVSFLFVFIFFQQLISHTVAAIFITIMLILFVSFHYNWRIPNDERKSKDTDER